MKAAILNIGDILFRINVLNPMTLQYFKNYLVSANISDTEEKVFDLPAVDRKELEAEKERLGNYEFAEYSLLFESIVNCVLPMSRFFFHGASFIWKDRAFIFTGKSGVGKTTQLRHWLSLYPDEIEIINGDKPMIEKVKDGFVVHPTPWGGKERIDGIHSARLGGIVILEQGNTDLFSKAKKESAVFTLFLQFLYIPDSIEAVDCICEYERQIIREIPVWKLINRGTIESAEMTHRLLLQEICK